MLWFQRDRSETLHPDYFNCLRCDREEKEIQAKPVQCPRCPLTEKLEFYKSEMIRLIKQQIGKFPDGYPLPQLMALHAQISIILERNRNHISKAWDRPTAELARIYLSERNHLRAVDNFEHQQRMKQK